MLRPILLATHLCFKTQLADMSKVEFPALQLCWAGYDLPSRPCAGVSSMSSFCDRPLMVNRKSSIGTASVSQKHNLHLGKKAVARNEAKKCETVKCEMDVLQI